MKVDKNNTIVDLAFNLCGSLAGIPVIVKQVPADFRVGLNQLPSQAEDDAVYQQGTSWTPDIAGMELNLSDMPLYNQEGKNKAPYSSNLKALNAAIDAGANLVYENENKVPWN